jgi:hypothetical protein
MTVDETNDPNQTNQAPPQDEDEDKDVDDDEDEEGELSLVDELGIEDLADPLAGGRGRLFSAAGRLSPVAEFTERFLVMHPPQLPFQEFDQGPAEDIVFHCDEMGILLDELGRQKRIAGAKFRGKSLYWLAERKPGTTKHYAGWFDESGKPHLLFVNDEPITTDIVFRLRNKTHDGELSIFPDLASDE